MMDQQYQCKAMIYARDGKKKLNRKVRCARAAFLAHFGYCWQHRMLVFAQAETKALIKEGK